MDIASELHNLLPSLRLLAGGIDVQPMFEAKAVEVSGNRIHLTGNKLVVSNTSDEPALSPDLIFNRFYRPSPKTTGNGLGLAIVKAICDYHRWRITYMYNRGWHSFVVEF